MSKVFIGILFITTGFSSCGLLKGHDGSAIYSALFDKTPDCVEMLHWQDQTVPIFDTAIMLHFKTCPEEVDRIVSLKNYDAFMEAGKHARYNEYGGNKWLNAELLGDSVMCYVHMKDAYGNGQTLYVNRQKNEAICIDIWN